MIFFPTLPGATETSLLESDRLPDWSYAGYQGRDQKIPRSTTAKIFTVQKQDGGGGGKGKDKKKGNNNKVSDTAAIKAAIKDAASAGGGIVYLPAGEYDITKRIKITSSNIVLRGDGPGKTILKPTRSLWDIDGFKPKSKDYISPYSRWDGFVSITGPTSISSDDRPSATKNEIYTPGIEVLANVTNDRPAGSRQFNVSDTSRISVGDLVRLVMSDPGSTDLINEMYSGAILQNCPNCLDGYKEGAVDIVHFPSKVAKVGNGYILLEREVPWPVRLQYRPQIRSYLKETPRDSGIEGLSIVFPHTQAAEHLLEKGYNGLYILNAVNCWVRDVEVVNSDSGIILHNVDLSTVDNLTLRVTEPRNSTKNNFDGHIGIGAAFANDVLIQNFKIKQRTLHDITVRATAHVVFLDGSGDDLAIDGHREGPWATLYSHLNLGQGNRPYSAGGNADCGYPFGSYTTFYDLRTNSNLPVAFPKPTSQGQCAFGTRLNFIGSQFDSLGPTCEGFWWFNTKQSPVPAGFALPQVGHSRSGSPQSSKIPALSPISSKPAGTGAAPANEDATNGSGGLSATAIIAIAVAGGVALASKLTPLLKFISINIPQQSFAFELD